MRYHCGTELQNRPTRMKIILVVCAVLLAMSSVRMRCSAQSQSITLTGQGESQNAQLGCGEKQLALDLHNYLRASQWASNIRQLVSA